MTLFLVAGASDAFEFSTAEAWGSTDVVAIARDRIDGKRRAEVVGRRENMVEEPGERIAGGGKGGGRKEEGGRCG